MQVVEIVLIPIFELFLHQHLLHVPRLDVLDLKDRSDSVGVHKFAEFMAIGQKIIFLESGFDNLTLIH